MDAEQRRQSILAAIHSSQEPIKGTDLSKAFQISRQVIVQDIALLRAAGHDIIATPQGYCVLKSAIAKTFRRILLMKHNPSDIYDELMSIVDLGGRIVDVIIEHPLYGEFRGRLMIAAPNDVREYLDRMEREGAEPLSALTEGVHLHTIEADRADVLDKIELRLRQKGYLLTEE